MSSSRPRRSLATAALALLVTACADTNTPIAQTSQPPVNPPPAREMTPAEPQSEECTETANIERGSLSGNGSGLGGVSDSAMYFTCGHGPQTLIALTKITSSSVTLVPYGLAEYTPPCFSTVDTCSTDTRNDPSSVLQKPPAGAPVTIEKSRSATVGPYQITVLSIDSGTAVLKVINPSR
jgi:hypothetical protein